MPLLECRGIRRLHGAEIVLDGVDLTLERGERVGLVGANGSGKTTLCRIILGSDEADGGTVTLAQGTHVGYLAQEPELDGSRSIRDEAMSAFAALQDLEAELHEASEAIGDAASLADPDELERRLSRQSRLLAEVEAGGGFDYEQRMLSALAGLGFGMGDLDRPVRQLSGGEKSRLALAKLLLSGCDLLLLDEPTNHLDIPMTEWLEAFLGRFSGGAVVVSHDRWFLDNVAHAIVELADGRACRYHFGAGDAKLPPPDDPEFQPEGDNDLERYGAYTHFVRVKAHRRAAEWKAYVSQQKELKRQEAWIRWKLNLRRESHVRAARSRQKMLAKLDRVARPADEAPVVQLEFEPLTRGPTDVVELRDCRFGFGDRTLFEGLELVVRRLDRVGIVGPNGCGKTTLLRLLLGEAAPTGGVAHVGPTARLGVYRQEQQDLDLSSTPLEELRRVVPDLAVPQVRGLLARFLFFGDDVFRPVHTFSGGERSRLALAKLLVARPNVLLLDEPTNHLDIPSREVLEEALQAFRGTLIVVSHDRYFLDRVCRRLLVFENRTAFVNEGGYRALQARREAALRAEAAAADQERRERRRAHLARERAAHEAKVAGQAALADRHSLRQLEERIAAVEAELTAVHDRFMDPSLYDEGRGVVAVQQEEARLKLVLEELYGQWGALLEADD